MWGFMLKEKFRRTKDAFKSKEHIYIIFNIIVVVGWEGFWCCTLVVWGN